MVCTKKYTFSGENKTHLRGIQHIVISLYIWYYVFSTKLDNKTFIFVLSYLLTFTTSGIYNAFTWTIKTEILLRKLDFIFILFAGVTPLMFDDNYYFYISLLAMMFGCYRIVIRMEEVDTHILDISVHIVQVLCGLAMYGICNYVFVASIFFSLGFLIYAIKAPNLVPYWFEYHDLYHVSMNIACLIIFKKIQELQLEINPN